MVLKMKNNIFYKDYDINIFDRSLTNDCKVIIYLKFYEWDKSDFNIKNCTLVSITKKDIFDYLSPWYSFDFKGKADILSCDLEEIINILKENNKFKNSKFYVVGYSLGGLASLYLCLKNKKLSGFASMSGSLWYPDFMNYFRNFKNLDNIEIAYLSIGDRETKGLNGKFKDIINYTKEVYDIFKNNDTISKFELNKGTHFDDVEERIEKGINFILNEK